MKRLISILTLVFACSTQVASAALEDAYSMIQISRGIWRVQCQDQSIMQVSTREILNQQLCGRVAPPNPQACFDATVAGMRTFEYDELPEIQEINQYCSQGDRNTAACITEAKRGLKSFDFDERLEGIEVIKACTQGIRRGNTNNTLVQCIQVSTRGLKTFEYDDREEIIEVVVACGLGTSQTYQCIEATTRNMRTFDYDDRDEILAIISSCY